MSLSARSLAPATLTFGGLHVNTISIVGAHYFAKPFPVGGPALTCVVRGRETGERLGARFEEVWQRGHDVLPVVREGLENLLGQ